MNVIVSVVIPTYKRDALLKQCMDALLLQAFDKSRYEIIVVDDAGREETKRLVEGYALGNVAPVIRYLPVQGRHGPAAARNRGWKAAQGFIIAFTDDDCLPRPDWLSRGTSAVRRGAAGVSGKIVVPLRHDPTDYELNTSFLEHSEFVTANCFYLKKALAEVNGFDERFTRAWHEDADLFFTLLKRNYRLMTVPEAVVVHPVRRGHWGISIREQSKSMFNALLYKKHRDLYKKKIHNPLLARYYAIVACSILSFLSMALNVRPIAAMALAAWILLTVSVCLTRLRGTSHSLRHITEMLVTSLMIPFLSVYWRLAGAIKFRVFFY